MTTVIFLESGEGLSSLRVLNIASLLLAVVVGPLLAASFPSPLSSAQPSLSLSLSRWCLSPLTSLLLEGRREAAKRKYRVSFQHWSTWKCQPWLCKFFQGCHLSFSQDSSFLFHSDTVRLFLGSIGRSVLFLPPNSVVSVGGGVGRNQRSLQPRDKMYIRGGFSGMSQCIFGE